MVTVPGQFNGPPRSGNGGWVCGLLADEWARRHGAGVITGTLMQPPPLDTTLTWEADEELGELRLLTTGGAVIGKATAGAFVDPPPPVISRDDAEVGAAAYLGHHDHPFDRCFTCGPAREPGDGLRIFSGSIGENRSAAPWEVHEALANEQGVISNPIGWAGLDCPGGWAGGFPEEVLLLGRMTAVLERAPEPGETLLATGWLRARDGRKRLTSTALYTEAGGLLGRSEQVWITVS